MHLWREGSPPQRQLTNTTVPHCPKQSTAGRRATLSSAVLQAGEPSSRVHCQAQRPSGRRCEYWNSKVGGKSRWEPSPAIVDTVSAWSRGGGRGERLRNKRAGGGHSHTRKPPLFGPRPPRHPRPLAPPAPGPVVRLSLARAAARSAAVGQRHHSRLAAARAVVPAVALPKSWSGAVLSSAPNGPTQLAGSSRRSRALLLPAQSTSRAAAQLARSIRLCLTRQPCSTLTPPPPPSRRRRRPRRRPPRRRRGAQRGGRSGPRNRCARRCRCRRCQRCGPRPAPSAQSPPPPPPPTAPPRARGAACARAQARGPPPPRGPPRSSRATVRNSGAAWIPDVS